MGVPPDGKQVRGYYDAWHTACRKAGLPGKLVHDFRRSAVRNLVRAGLSERVATLITIGTPHRGTPLARVVPRLGSLRSILRTSPRATR